MADFSSNASSMCAKGEKQSLESPAPGSSSAFPTHKITAGYVDHMDRSRCSSSSEVSPGPSSPFFL